MKYTVLEIVNQALSSISSDEVNSINDTIEALQVADIVEAEYFNMVSVGDWEHLRKLGSLTALSDVTKPSHMKLPDELSALHWVTYDKQRTGDAGRKRIEPVTYLYPDQFIQTTSGRNNLDSNIQSVTDVDGTILHIYNDRAPQYWTSFDDEYIVFDSFDSSIDTTLQESKSQCLFNVSPTFTKTDTYTVDLPDEAFPALVNAVKLASWEDLKQAPNNRIAKAVKDQTSWLSVNRWRSKGGVRFDGYGRKKGTSNWKFDKN